MFAKPILDVEQLKSVWEYGVLDYPAVHVTDILRFFEKEKVELQVGIYFNPVNVDPFITVSYNAAPGVWIGNDGKEFIDVLYKSLMRYLEETHTKLGEEEDE